VPTHHKREPTPSGGKIARPVYRSFSTASSSQGWRSIGPSFALKFVHWTNLLDGLTVAPLAR
ncbi:MAG: hypothetical protein AAF724_19600, partial [Pseudomonadota bacterium]